MLPLNQPSSLSRVRVVGILHSQSGTMALTESSSSDAALMAIASGTVDGAGACNPTEVERQPRKLIQSERVASVFGGLTWATPKAAKPVLEELDVLPSCGR